MSTRRRDKPPARRAVIRAPGRQPTHNASPSCASRSSRPPGRSAAPPLPLFLLSAGRSGRPRGYGRDDRRTRSPSRVPPGTARERDEARVRFRMSPSAWPPRTPAAARMRGRLREHVEEFDAALLFDVDSALSVLARGPRVAPASRTRRRRSERFRRRGSAAVRRKARFPGAVGPANGPRGGRVPLPVGDRAEGVPGEGADPASLHDLLPPLELRPGEASERRRRPTLPGQLHDQTDRRARSRRSPASARSPDASRGHRRTELARRSSSTPAAGSASPIGLVPGPHPRRRGSRALAAAHCPHCCRRARACRSRRSRRSPVDAGRPRPAAVCLRWTASPGSSAMGPPTGRRGAAGRCVILRARGSSARRDGVRGELPARGRRAQAAGAARAGRYVVEQPA